MVTSSLSSFVGVCAQPSSTPGENRRRFLTWNMVGVIISRDEHIYNTIDIEFHDSAKNRPGRVTDHYGFTMGALSEQGGTALRVLAV